VAFVPGLTEETVDLMSRSGCRQVLVGLESLSPRLLALMNKNHDPEHAIRVLEIFKRTDINVSLSVIIGFPTETEKEAWETIRFLSTRKDLYQNSVINQFYLEENTVIYENPDKFGITRIYGHNRDYGVRMGFRYDTQKGMSQNEARLLLKNVKHQINRRG
jgi:anaerobic magnesium-protoporphyrin IX monomethyl ester cyclase